MEALEAAEEARSRGRVALQLRDKILGDEELTAVGRALMPHAQRAGVPLLVNERRRVAHEIDANGIHLPEYASGEALDPSASHGAWVGASVHDAAGVVRRRDADVLVLGPLEAVEGKNPPLSDASFADCVATAVQPVLALGGIRTSLEVRRALRLGAHGIAVQRAFSHAPHGGEALSTWLQHLNEARANGVLSTKLRP